jgi:hypothetical protein
MLVQPGYGVGYNVVAPALNRLVAVFSRASPVKAAVESVKSTVKARGGTRDRV